MVPHKILVALGVLRHILVHPEAYREAHRDFFLGGDSLGGPLSSLLSELLGLEIISIHPMSYAEHMYIYQ